MDCCAPSPSPIILFYVLFDPFASCSGIPNLYLRFFFQAYYNNRNFDYKGFSIYRSPFV